ncbi:hypothetical protein [Flavobacterium branchiophilum]|nr:hypothetical protein [Flavobacterium branchiophilum]
MIQDSFDLVHHLLADKKLTLAQKERVFQLSSNFMKTDSELIKTLDKQLKNINEKVEGLEKRSDLGDVLGGAKKGEKKIVVKKHKPKDVANFMHLFNNPNGLKYLTHDFDQQKDFDIELFLENTKKVFERETKKLKIPSYLYSIVNEFSFNENPNWGNGMNEGFSCNKWKNWSKEYKLSPFRNPEFITTINEFRKLTRIEAPDLKNYTEDIIQEVFQNTEVEYSLNRLENADFYTNTPFFISAIKSILEIIRDKSSKLPIAKFNITYKGTLKDNYYQIQIQILHFNSFPTKDFNQLHPEWKSGKGTIGEIKEKLFGYCNWSIESKFDNGHYRINLLKDTNDPDFELISNENCIGTKHILTFYYKTSD